jgi:hypothetical protein
LISTRGEASAATLEGDRLMKTFASAVLAATIAAAAVTPALACPYSNKEASLTDKDSYKTAQNETKKDSDAKDSDAKAQ